MREIGLAMACTLLSIASAHAALEPKSRNAVLFVESAQKGHEWEAYRLAEDRRPVVFEVRGPGRVLLSLRTFADSEAERAVSVVLLDDRIILTAEVDPKVDETAKFPAGLTEDRPNLRRPTKVRFYLVRIPSGQHVVTVRYSGGEPTLVAARFSETDRWEESDEGGLPLARPKSRAEDPSSVGALRDDESLESEPQERPPWKERGPAKEEVSEPRTGPPRAAPDPARAPPPSASPPESELRVDHRPLSVQVPWLAFEIGVGAQLERLVPAIGPAALLEVRFPIPALDARRFSLGGTAELSHASAQSEVLSSGAVIGVARVRHTAIAASFDLRWSFLQEQAVDPYLGLGAGAVFGSIDTIMDDHRLSAGTRGGFAVLIAGAALGGVGHRPFLEGRFSAGAMRSDLLREGTASHLAATLLLGYRFELLAEAAIEAPSP